MLAKLLTTSSTSMCASDWQPAQLLLVLLVLLKEQPAQLLLLLRRRRLKEQPKAPLAAGSTNRDYSTKSASSHFNTGTCFTSTLVGDEFLPGPKTGLLVEC